jgi:hypothetical protein
MRKVVVGSFVLATAALCAAACDETAGAIGDTAADADVGGRGRDAGPDDVPRPTPDAAPQPDAPAPVAVACKRVDVVIAVDASSSMTEELTAIRDTVFPAFADRLVLVGEGLEDFRVGTLDACPIPASLHTRGAATADCAFHGGNPWIESASPALADEFACVGDIFLGDIECTQDNDDEQPASAAAAALLEPYGATANAGFLRDDALLVVVAITDEDEQPTGAAQTAAEVRDQLLATKGGDAGRVVLLGIGGGSDCQGVYGDADEAIKLREITSLFGDRGLFWDLCDGQLEDGLEAALSVIDDACEELPPVEEPEPEPDGGLPYVP